MSLTSEQMRRYARHVILPEVGETGQKKLLASSVLVVGAGGLGSAALAYLSASGIGRLGIVDGDRVELSNLQRQVLFEQADIGRAKVDAARDRIYEVNPECKVDVFNERLTEVNARALIQGFDIVLDGSDNFETRFIISDACLYENKTLISAAISGFLAQLSTFKAHLGPPHPCYHCLVPEAPPRARDCAQEGIIGPLAGMLGSMQALEAIKELLEMEPSLSGTLLVIDGRSLAVKRVTLTRDAKCPTCNSHLERRYASR